MKITINLSEIKEILIEKVSEKIGSGELSNFQFEVEWNQDYDSEPTDLKVSFDWNKQELK